MKDISNIQICVIFGTYKYIYFYKHIFKFEHVWLQQLIFIHVVHISSHMCSHYKNHPPAPKKNNETFMP